MKPRPASLPWLAGLALTALLASGAVPAQPADPAAVTVATRPAYPSAAWPARIGRLALLKGDARVLDRDEDRWIAAVANQPLTEGDHFYTEPGTRAEIRIGSAVLRLDGATELRFQRLDDEAIVLELRSGSLALKLPSQTVVSQLEVLSFEGRLKARQPGHYRIDQRDGATEATTWRGELQFDARDARLVVPAGRRAEVWLKGSARRLEHAWFEVARDGFADWVAYEDTAQGRDLATTLPQQAEITGWEELDRHGSWQQHPEYGGVWIPAGVPAGWAPYQQGRWVWVSSWGWTWVDQARWGFTPFHYGRWQLWGNRWCWVPGPRIRPPAPPPAVHAGDRRVPRPPPPRTIATVPGGSGAHGGVSFHSGRDLEPMRPPERPPERSPVRRSDREADGRDGHDPRVDPRKDTREGREGREPPPRRPDVPTPRVPPSFRAEGPREPAVVAKPVEPPRVAAEPQRNADVPPRVAPPPRPPEPREPAAKPAEAREPKQKVPEQQQRTGQRVQTQ